MQALWNKNRDFSLPDCIFAKLNGKYFIFIWSFRIEYKQPEILNRNRNIIIKWISDYHQAIRPYPFHPESTTRYVFQWCREYKFRLPSPVSLRGQTRPFLLVIWCFKSDADNKRENWNSWERNVGKSSWSEATHGDVQTLSCYRMPLVLFMRAIIITNI